MKTPKGFSPIIAIVIVLVVGLAAGAAIYLTTRETVTNTNNNTNQSVINENQNTNTNANVNTNTNVNANANVNVNASVNTNTTVGETTNWKTYTNEKYAFEVKYPAEWKMAQNNTASKDEEMSMLKNDSLAFHISISQAKTTLDEWTNKLKTETSSKENLVFNGLPAVKMTFNDFPGAPNTESYYFIKNNNLYSLSFTIPAVVDASTESQILSTFQFTDETANWKTYTNEKYGYLLKFPSNWVWASAYDGLEKEITDSSLINSNSNLFIVKGSEGFVIQACSMASVIECSPNSVSKWRQNKDIGKEETITLGNAKFTKIKLKDDPSNWYITENGNYFYEIRVMDTSSTAINKILSTFQFTDETAGWKMYENTLYKYSFKYPKDWQLGDSPMSSTPSPTATDIAFDGGGYAGNRFAVQVRVVSNCTTMKECVEKNRMVFAADQTASALSEAIIGGNSALTETITRPTSGDWKYYVHYVYKAGNLYTIFTTAKATDDSATKLTFDRILSTFQFTNETAGWKTYTNSKYSFSIKYPKTDSSISYPSSINSNEEWVASKEISTSDTLAIIGFGPPSSKSGGYIWGITVMSSSNTTLDKQIASQGSQWSDRKESKTTTMIDGNAATVVTVTTTSYPNWISKVVYIEKGGNIFEIGNGAIESISFDNFYKSFQFTK